LEKRKVCEETVGRWGHIRKDNTPPHSGGGDPVTQQTMLKGGKRGGKIRSGKGWRRQKKGASEKAEKTAKTKKGTERKEIKVKTPRGEKRG